MLFGASTFRQFLQLLSGPADAQRDEWVDRMRACPATVVSSTLQGPLDWPDVTVVAGDAVEVVRRMKEESPVPIRSHGSLSLNRALLEARTFDGRTQELVYRPTAHPWPGA